MVEKEHPSKNEGEKTFKTNGDTNEHENSKVFSYHRVLSVISLLVAIIVIFISIVYILHKKEIELVYTVFVLLLVGISLWILQRVTKMAEILEYKELVLPVIFLLVAFIIVIFTSLLHILQKIGIILQGKEIEVVYSVFVLLLVGVSLWILHYVIKKANIGINEKLRIHKKEFKKVVHSLIGLILAIIISCIVVGSNVVELKYGILLSLFIFILGEILYVVYFNFPAVESLIHGDNIIELLEGVDEVFIKQLEVINMAEKGDVIYCTTCEAPFKESGHSKYYRLKNPWNPRECNVEWEAYKRLHARVNAKEIKLRRLAPLIYFPDKEKNEEYGKNIKCISEWFETLHNEIDHEELYKLRYTTEPYYRRMLYLEPKDTNKPPICIMGTIEAMPLPKDYYGLYIQSKALRGTIGNEIKTIFENSKKYTDKKNLLEVLQEKIKNNGKD